MNISFCFYKANRRTGIENRLVVARGSGRDGVGHSDPPFWVAPLVPGCVIDTWLMLSALGGSVPGPGLGHSLCPGLWL